MKRGGPIARKNAIARGTKPLTRAAPLRARPPAPRAPEPANDAPPRAPRRAPRAPAGAPTSDVRAAVHARDRVCVICGRPGTNLQHRQRRGMGGRQGDAARAANQPPALILLCGSGTTGCHGWVTDHAPRDVVAAAGWELPRSHPTPVEREPVWVAWRREWVVLVDERAVPIPLPPLSVETLAPKPPGM